MAGEETVGVVAGAADVQRYRIVLHVPVGVMPPGLAEGLARAVSTCAVRVEMKHGEGGDAMSSLLRTRYGIPVHRLVDPGEEKLALSTEEYLARDIRERVRATREQMLKQHPVLAAMATKLHGAGTEPGPGHKWVSSIVLEATFDGPALPEKVVVRDVLGRHSDEDDGASTGEIGAFLARCEVMVSAAMRATR